MVNGVDGEWRDGDRVETGRRTSWRPTLDVLIAGAQKAATSSMFSYLASHRDVVGSFGNEFTLYSDVREYQRGAEWAWRRFFPQCSHPCRAAHVHLGKSVDVLPDPEAHRRAFADNPNLEIVCVLREPVQRAYSAYQWAVSRGIERSKSFEAAVEIHGDRSIDGRPTHGNYLVNGVYWRQLDELEHTFPRSQIHVLFYDDVVGGDDWSPALLAAVGLPPARLHTGFTENQTHRPRSAWAARALAHRGSLRSAAGRVLPLRMRFAITSQLWRLNSSDAVPERIPEHLVSRLSEYFHDADAQLEGYVGRPVPWRAS